MTSLEQVLQAVWTIKHCASCSLSGKLYEALLREQPDLPNAQSIISKHLANIKRGNGEFLFIDKDGNQVRPAERVHSQHCTVWQLP